MDKQKKTNNATFSENHNNQINDTNYAQNTLRN